MRNTCFSAQPDNGRAGTVVSHSGSYIFYYEKTRLLTFNQLKLFKGPHLTSWAWGVNSTLNLSENKNSSEPH